MFRRTRRFSLPILCLLILGFLGLPALAQTPVPGDVAPTQPAPIQTATAGAAPSVPSVPLSSSTRLAAGDLIDVNVYGVPDLATKARIGNGGDVYLPLIDYVHIADLSVDEAQELIQKRLEDGGFLRNPHVSIFVNESASQAVNMMGELVHPGTYPVIGDRHLFDMISAAGGLTERAGQHVTIIHRQDPDHKVELNLPSNLAEDTATNVEITPGDTVVVSRAGIVYVVGDVVRPSGFAVEDNTLTVLKVLALAGGGTRTAALNNSKILRQTPTGVHEIPVKLQKILHAKAPDVAMIKGDILFVPGSAGKAVAYRGAEAAVSLTSALTILAVHP